MPEAQCGEPRLGAALQDLEDLALAAEKHVELARLGPLGEDELVRATMDDAEARSEVLQRLVPEAAEKSDVTKLGRRDAVRCGHGSQSWVHAALQFFLPL